MIMFVHQPEYLPWLGFFDRLSRCDFYVIYDNVQFEHGGFQNRNRVRTQSGWTWLTIPLKHEFPQHIDRVKIQGSHWMDEHLKTIKMNYENSPYFDDYFPMLEDAFSKDWKMLADLNLHLIQKIAEILKINVTMVKSSELPLNEDEKNKRLISICELFATDTYLSGPGSRTYMREDMFNKNGIKVVWHDYWHPVYKQRFYGFIPNMSTIDALFNVGPRARKLIRDGGVLSEHNGSSWNVQRETSESENRVE